MGKTVHVLEVSDPSIWQEVEAVVDLAPLVERELDPTRRAVRRGAERAIVPALRQRGMPVLVREAPGASAEPDDPGPALAALSGEARRVLHLAQRRAFGRTVVGPRTWHPVTDRAAVEELEAAGLLASSDPGTRSMMGTFVLHPSLPPPPAPGWDLEEAFFDPPDDLEAASPGLGRLLEDAAVLAAAIRHVQPRRTHQGHLDRAACRRLGRRLHDPKLVEKGDLGRADPRWRRALDLLLGIEAVVEDEIHRTLHVQEATLVAALRGGPADRLDRTLRRVAPPEVQPLLWPLRAALHQAGERAVDDVVLLELLAEHEDDPDAFVEEERPLLDEALGLLAALGLVRRAPGAFAATRDGLTWSGHPTAPASPLWISSDLEIVVPPGAVGPLERYRLERLARPLARDVVDRLRLERDGLADWLVDHDVDEALALLRRLSPAVPATIEDTLRAWANTLTRVVLVRDVVLEAPAPARQG